ncbi:MAG: ATP-binding cassette domain-containing protein [Candidatus Bipolaricaulia bacterium]
MEMISTKGLTREFDGIVAVRDLDLDIEEGEVFGFLGPNGAGKTTTVRMLTCLIAPTSGRAFVTELEVGIDDQEIRRQVGVLTEAPGLYEKLSAYRNLEFYAELYGVPDQEKKRQIEKYLHMLDLWSRKDDPVGSFSKGMRQKVAIARTLLHEPKVLFLDEPTSGLDPEAAKIVRDFIAELAEQERTIFLCTHNLDEADRLCDRIGFMNEQLIEVGTPEGLKGKRYGKKIAIHLRKPLLGIERALDFDFVEEIHPTDNRLIITLSDPETQNPLLIKKIVEMGGEIQYVNELKHSLEDVYLELMKEGDDDG